MKSEHQIFKLFLHVSGLAMVGNGLWMVMGAIKWFFNIPADMPATGDPNGHLIRDVGFAYIVFGALAIPRVWTMFVPESD